MSNTVQNAGKYLWLLNALMFQMGWFICVMGGNHWALIYTLPVTLLHLLRYPNGARDFTGLIVSLVLGLLHDNALAISGVLVFAGGAAFSPPWLWCLWILMALTLNHSLQWIYSRPKVAALAGAVFGPFAYIGGVSLSDIQWGQPLGQSVLALVIIWLFVLPLHRYLTIGIGSLCTQKYSP